MEVTMFTKNLSILLLCSGIALNASPWSRFTAAITKAAVGLGALKAAEVAGDNKRTTGSIIGQTAICRDIQQAYTTGEALHQADIARINAARLAEAQATAEFNEAARFDAIAENSLNRDLTRTEKAKYWVKDSRGYKGLASVLDTVKTAAINEWNQERSLEAGKQRIIAGASYAKEQIMTGASYAKDGLASVIEYGKAHVPSKDAVKIAAKETLQAGKEKAAQFGSATKAVAQDALAHASSREALAETVKTHATKRNIAIATWTVAGIGVMAHNMRTEA